MIESNKKKFISKIVFQVRRKSRRWIFFRRKSLKRSLDEIHLNQLKEIFFHRFEFEQFYPGQQIQFNRLIFRVEQIQYDWWNEGKSTEIEFIPRGFSSIQSDENRISFPLSMKKNNDETSKDHRVDQIYSCYCSSCWKLIDDEDLFIQTGNLSEPIVCLSCFQLFNHLICVRCDQLIFFHYDQFYKNEYLSIRYVQLNHLFWHSKCFRCFQCSTNLIGKEFSQQSNSNLLFCLNHFKNIPIDDKSI